MSQHQPLVLEAVIELLKQDLLNIQNCPNPYQARYTVDAISSVVAGIIDIVEKNERLESSWPTLTDLVNTGKTVSDKVPRICRECGELYQGAGKLCSFCGEESASRPE